MKNLILTALLCSGTFAAGAQQACGVTQCGTPTGQNPMPIIEYSELPNPVKADPTAWAALKNTAIGWGSTDVRYKKETPYNLSKSQSIHLTGWQGERVNAQFVISAPKGAKDVTFSVSNLVNTKDKSQIIPAAENVLSGYVRYVMTDGPNSDGKTACGFRDNTKYDSTLVADAIDHHLQSITLPENTTTGAWVRVWIPQNCKPGLYKGTVTVSAEGKPIKTLPIEITATDRTLPVPDKWTFHLDLWQNPYAIARYYGVDLWSKAHFDAMRPHMKILNEAGLKVITTSITHRPWDGQTEDPYATMVTWIKKADGTWAFDYTVFDMWVNFMMECGVTEQIACYSMVPWRLSFQYLDQASGTFKFAETKPGEKEYDQMWEAMLRSFAAHLKEKGWFDRTCISMDERPLDVMFATIKVIKAADKDFKISFAGNYHPELFSDVHDYSAAIVSSYTEAEKEARRSQGKRTTFYTCCTEAYPNIFTFSAPAEAAWLGIYAAKEDLDGYLRWSSTHWVKEPLLDSRFRAWGGGDTYHIYPGGRTSIRMERQIEGIQTYEKIKILKAELKAKGDTESIAKIDEALKAFDYPSLGETKAEIAVNHLNAVINSL